KRELANALGRSRPFNRNASTGCRWKLLHCVDARLVPTRGPTEGGAVAEAESRRRRAMGALEAEVLPALWSLGDPATPADVHARLNGLAYSTVVTTLTRLFEKGLLERTRVGRAYAYVPLVSEAELIAQRMQKAL